VRIKAAGDRPENGRSWLLVPAVEAWGMSAPWASHSEKLKSDPQERRHERGGAEARLHVIGPGALANFDPREIYATL